MSRFGRLCVALVCFCLQLFAAGALLPGSAAAATPLSPESLGINFTARRPISPPLRRPASAWPAIQVIAGTQYRCGRRVDRRRASAALPDAGHSEEPGRRGRRRHDGRVRDLVRAAVRTRGLVLGAASGASLPAGGELRDRQRARHHPDRAGRSDLASLRGPGGLRAGVRGGARRASPGRPRRARRSSAGCSTRVGSGSIKPSSTWPRSARWTRWATTPTSTT